MIAKEHIVLILILMIFQSAIGQTGNHLVDGVGFQYTFDDSDNLVIDYVENKEILVPNFITSPYCISGYNGELLEYGRSLPYHPANDPIDLDDKFTSQSTTFRISDSVHLVFYLQEMKANWRDPSNKNIYYRKLHIYGNRATFADEPAKRLVGKHIHSITSIADTSGGHWLVMRHDVNKYTSYYYKESDLPIDSSFSEIASVDKFNDIPAAFNKVSPSGNYILTHWQSAKNVTDTFSLSRESLKLLAFDKESGKVEEYQTIYQEIDTFWYSEFKENNETVLRYGIIGEAFEVSADDTYTYLSESISSKYDAGVNKLIRVNNNTLNTVILSEEPDGKIVDTLVDGSTGTNAHYHDIKLLNNRKLYCKKYIRFNDDSQTTHFVFSVIEYPNSPLSLLEDAVLKSPNDKNASGHPFSKSPYNYLIVKPSIVEGECISEVTFIDKCDYSLPNTKVTYYTEDVAGSGVLVARGENPTLTYTKSGNYLCKVILKSHEGTYKEVWYDTLKIRMPPVADFTAADTLVCAHVPLEFTNQSVSDTVHPAQGELWVWTFGDGETETVSRPFDSAQDDLTPPNVTHTYTRPGTYTVSLFYSNGFCDSTLVKNRYITVVDAPAPGFSIDDTRGCTPVTLILTDTITKNTTKKEYNYNDGRGWVGVPVDQENFSQTYTTAGTYWIVQRLYGYTNCVTQQDSIQVFLSPGFTEDNKTNVALVSYQDVPAEPRTDEVVTVMWHTNIDTASSYEVYRDGKLIKELAAFAGVYNSADDSLVLERAGLNYAVVALDSCDTRTQAGRIGNPIQVTGKVIGDNDMSIISHTGYEELLLGTREISYSLQTFEYNEWVELNSQNNTLDYEDPRFLNFVNEGLQLEKSYRVVGSTNISSDKTISNILRLPYKPILFLPTAFTPNADGLNDVWLPITFGVEHYEVDIYNRYGQKIVHFTEQDAGWSAEDVAMGGYMVIIRAKGTDNEWYNLKSTVTVVR
ncbi:MAG: gliding motility-associated-like protein [Bacteroidia bacterium]|jgi:gliding motility-associated-like protein|tara:strand:+ start:276 stop:3197 length:2922 start_codon:yes stop_codon:yes gene_type:complete